MTQNHPCPICGSATVSKRIDYIDWSGGHILVIREVPVRECLDFGHQFMEADAAKKIEALFNSDQRGALHPQEVLKAPVVTLDAAEHILL